MKIATKKTTVRELLAKLENADPNEEVSFTRANPKTKSECWCGCGGMTGNRFVPGHDSRFHGSAKRVARGQADRDEALHVLPHDEAVAEFERHVAIEEPLHAAREEGIAGVRKAREEAKAEAKRVRELATA